VERWQQELDDDPDREPGTRVGSEQIARVRQQLQTSVWSVSVSASEIKYLYPCECMNQEILWWLDDKRYIAYEGSFDALDVARNLRLVDTASSTTRVLFDGDFVQESFDPIHQTFALYELYAQNIRRVSTWFRSKTPPSVTWMARSIR